MANQNFSSMPHNIPVSSSDLSADQLVAPNHEAVLDSLIPMPLPIPVSSSAFHHEMPMSSNFTPPNILNSASANEFDDQGVVGSPVVRQSKPRGRPRGSKNKPKAARTSVEPPKPAESASKVHILEIQPGSDVVESVQRFCRTHNVGIVFTSGLGRLRNVSLRSYLAHEPAINNVGTFDLVGINGVHVGSAVLTNKEETTGKSYSYFNGSHSNFMSIVVRGPRGIIFGGMVAGRLVAASTVLLTANTFANYEFHRLDSEVNDHQIPRPNSSGGGSSMGGPGSDPGSSSGLIGFIDDGLNWDPNPKDRKRIRFTDY